MKNYLSQPDTAFYHITRRVKWENSINQKGLTGDDEGRIFVSRSSNVGVLASIALNQLLGLGEDADLVVLKLRQSLNNFLFEELAFDHQSNELTFPFQNIIYRSYIPVKNIEWHSEIKMSIDELGIIANRSDIALIGSALLEEALQITYEDADNRCYRFAKQNPPPLFSKMYI